MDEPIFKSKISNIDIFQNSGIFLFVGVALYFRNINDNFNSKCLTLGFIFILLIWNLTRFKLFILYKNKLIVRSIFFTSKADTIYKTNQINQIVFKFMSGKFGGNKMIVYSIFINDYDFYSINMKSDEINQFVLKLREANVEVINNLKK